MVLIVKGEPSGSSRGQSDHDEGDDQNEGNGLERRVLRSRYLAVKNLISDRRDDITRADSDKFRSIFDEVECLHQLVQKPREQVADAEALLDITNTLMTSVKAQSNEGVTAGDFVSCLLKNFGRLGGGIDGGEETRNSVRWKDIGVAVSHVFIRGDGCCTMLGPMNSEVKQRRAVVQRRQSRPTEKARPEELAASVTEEKTDTDKNMATMFNILRKNRNVKLENLVLNRSSFAQTVENLFALSFLVKDGRAEIKVDEKGCHLVSPRNAPAANAVASKEVSYTHFIFRFDFRDWKLMLESVSEGDELMPHRNPADTSPNSRAVKDKTVLPTTPIRKFSRNRGLVLQEQMVVEDSPESGDSESRGGAIRKGKRKLSMDGCPFGENCHFLHYFPGGYKCVAQLMNLPPISTATQNGPSATSKSKLCKNYTTTEGCKFGDQCHFAHGEWELGKPIAPSHEDPRNLAPVLGRPAPQAVAASFGASYTAKISVDASLTGAIIGKGGVNSKQICRQTGAKLSIRDHESDTNLKNIELEGTFDQIKEASAIVRELISSVTMVRLAATNGPPTRPPAHHGAQPHTPAGNKKTKLCENFAKGSCTFGERCHFAHGATELRKTGV